MTSLDGGVKYHGLSVEAEYYWRTLSDFEGIGTAGIATINDHGYQLQLSAMPVRDVVQVGDMPFPWPYIDLPRVRGKKA